MYDVDSGIAKISDDFEGSTYIISQLACIAARVIALQ